MVDMMFLRHQHQYISRGGDKSNDLIYRVCGSQERPGKRARTIENNSHDTDVSTRMDFPNHNDMPVQQNSNIRIQFPRGHLVYGSCLAHKNMGAAYPSPVTGHHDAQNNGGFFVDRSAAPINYHGAAGPGLVQNNTNPFMGHEPAQTTHGFVTGGGGVQKRKHADM